MAQPDRPASRLPGAGSPQGLDGGCRLGFGRGPHTAARREGRRPRTRRSWPEALAAARPWPAKAARSESRPRQPSGQAPASQLGPPGGPNKPSRRGVPSPHTRGGCKAALRPKMAVSQATIPPRPARRRAAAPSARGGSRPPQHGGRRGRSGLAYRAARPERPRQAAPLPGWLGDGERPRWRSRLTSPGRTAPPQRGRGRRAGEGGGGGRAAPGALPDG